MRGLFLLHCGQFQAVCEKIMFIFEGNEIETDSEGYLERYHPVERGDGGSHCRAGRDNARR